MKQDRWFTREKIWQLFHEVVYHSWFFLHNKTILVLW